MKNEDVETRLWILPTGDIGGEVDEASGFESGPEADFVGKRDGILFEVGDLRGGRLAVEGLERELIAGKDGGAPLCEGWE